MSIAKQALNNYSITCSSIDFIGQSANTIYKIIDLENNCYSLRLHLSKSETLENIWTEQEVIRSEMVWLHSLALDTDLTLPSPFKNIHGEVENLTSKPVIHYSLDQLMGVFNQLRMRVILLDLQAARDEAGYDGGNKISKDDAP